MGDKHQSPRGILFNLTLLRLALSLCKYKEMHTEANPSFKLSSFHDKMMEHFREHQPDLLTPLTNHMKSAVSDIPYNIKSFDWTGGDFTLVPLSECPPTDDDQSVGELFHCWFLIHFELFIYLF